MAHRYEELIAQSRGRSLANEAAGQDWNDAGRGVGPPPPPPPQSVDFTDTPAKVEGTPPPPDERPLDLNIPKTTQASASNPLTQLGKAVTGAKPDDSTPDQLPTPTPDTAGPAAAKKGLVRPEVKDYLEKKYAQDDTMKAALKASLEEADKERMRHSFDRFTDAMAWRKYDPTVGERAVAAARQAPIAAAEAASGAHLSAARAGEIEQKGELEAGKERRIAAEDNPADPMHAGTQALALQMMPSLKPEEAKLITNKMFPEISRLAQARETTKANTEERLAAAKELAQSRRDVGQMHYDTMKAGADARTNEAHWTATVTPQGAFMVNTKTGETRPITAPGGGEYSKTKPTVPAYYGEDFEPIHADAPPALKDKELEELRHRYTSNSMVQKQLAEYKAAIQKAGPLDRIAGPAAQTLITMQGELKPTWVESKGFKRYTENENKLLDTVLPTPAGPGVWKLPSSAMAAIDQLSKTAAGDIHEQLRTRGLQLKGQGGQSAGAMIDVISPEGRPGQIPAANWSAAEKKGFKRAGP